MMFASTPRSDSLRILFYFVTMLLIIFDFLIWTISLRGPWTKLQNFLNGHSKMRSLPKCPACQSCRISTSSLEDSGDFESLSTIDSSSGTGCGEILLPQNDVDFKDDEIIENLNELKCEQTMKEFLEKATTVHQLIQQTFSFHGSMKAQGSREFLGRTTLSYECPSAPLYGEVKWRTYHELNDAASAFGRGLRHLNLCDPLTLQQSLKITEEFESFPNGHIDASCSKVGLSHCCVIFAQPSCDWMLCLIGCMSQSFPVLLVHHSSSVEMLVRIINQSHASTLFCDVNQMARLRSIHAQCPSMRALIYHKHNMSKLSLKLDKTRSGRSSPMSRHPVVLSLNEVVAAGWSVEMHHIPPKPNHLAVMLYTSGTTGAPKGVMLKHCSVVAAIRSLLDSLDGCLTVSTPDHQERHLCQLSSARSFPFLVELSLLIHGAQVCYCGHDENMEDLHEKKYENFNALFHNSAQKNLENGSVFELNNFKAFKPSLFVGTPISFDSVQDEILSQIYECGDTKKELLISAVVAKSLAIRQDRSSVVSSLFLMKELNQILGGEVKLLICSGGELSPHVQLFVEAALNLNVVQTYGLSETCGLATMQSYDDWKVGVVGGPVKGVEVSLISCLTPLDPQGNPYLYQDTSHGVEKCLGRGEILIKGEMVTSGYYLQKDESSTAVEPELLLEQSIKEEDLVEGVNFSGDLKTGVGVPQTSVDQAFKNRILHTEDIGVWSVEGDLKLVDRLKLLVKLKNGMYVGLETMEKVFNQSAFVSRSNGGVLCFADGEMNQPVAIVQASERDLVRWAIVHGVDHDNFEQLCQDAIIQELVLNDLNSIGQGNFRSASFRENVSAPWAAHIYMNSHWPTLSKYERIAGVVLISGDGCPEKPPEKNSPWTVSNELLNSIGGLNRRRIQSLLSVELKGLRIMGL